MVTRLPLDHDRAVERRRLHIREVSEGGGEVHASVGEELRAARLRLGEDLRTVSSALRIREEHLEAIEGGAFDRLPGRAYAIGFVRAYAEYLGLDAAAIVARFKEEAGLPPAPVLQPAVFEESSTEEERQPQGLLIALLLLFLIGLGFAVYFAKSADKMLAPQAPPLGAAAPDKSPPAEAAAPPATPQAAPKEDKAAAPKAEAAPPAAAAAAEAVPDSGHSFGATNGVSRVTVKALRNGVWLRIEDQTSGEVLITRKLKAGDRFLVPDRPNLVLVTRDGGSLELTLDGAPIGRAGGPGTVIDGMSLNADTLAGRLPPSPPASAPGSEGADAAMPAARKPPAERPAPAEASQPADIVAPVSPQ
jgi:cytoskeleton protein RodZ